MKFVDTAVNKSKRYSIGREAESGRCYLSIPVSNSMADYEEFYEIGEDLHNGYPDNELVLSIFADDCRRRLHDQLLFLKPGSDRGVAT
ncbi:MAG: hypothetical protein O9256_04415 [Rhizobiaceae bacterium]|nr:hypothetical protein [Rhizobiaceae bacterium]